MKLKVGQKAPEFKLPDQDGKIHTLSEYKGRWLLVYFYPKDNTSGCTKEACMLRDDFPTFEKLDAKVVGISGDSVKSHKEFAKDYKLPFTLLADEKKSVLNKYSVWQEKTLYGKKYMGTVRTSFLINPEGKIAKIYNNVKPDIHAQEVLKDLKSLK